MASLFFPSPLPARSPLPGGRARRRGLALGVTLALAWAATGCTGGSAQQAPAGDESTATSATAPPGARAAAVEG
ncbi:hypothetical protein, partial [Cellulosimicrobium cellulans]|uniref:hypothetical protein n=1 Tax=Cellulosimicrobium cellulans TaxID=1710 RepID=UPI001C0AA9A1